MVSKKMAGVKAGRKENTALAWVINADEEAFLDQLTGEAMLEGVRLEKVMRVRARLLQGGLSDTVLSFSRDVLHAEGW